MLIKRYLDVHISSSAEQDLITVYSQPSGITPCSFPSKVVVIITRTLTAVNVDRLVYTVLTEISLFTYIFLSGFGGLEVACWPLVPKFAGSNPAEAVGFLRVNKS